MLEIRVGEDGVIHLSGRFDASQVDKAEAVFGGALGSTTVDCSNLDYISSAGIGVVLKTLKRLNDSGQVLKLVNVKQSIKNIFHVAGLDRFLEIE
jgi:anti-sigma B factor antagonist